MTPITAENGAEQYDRLTGRAVRVLRGPCTDGTYYMHAHINEPGTETILNTVEDVTAFLARYLARKAVE